MLAELKTKVCQNILVHALDAEPQKNRPYQSDIYTVSFHAIPRQAREQDRFDTSLKMKNASQVCCLTTRPGGLLSLSLTNCPCDML